MSAVRIYQPRKTAMQSGRARTKYWLVEFEPGARVKNDRLMGWTGAGDTRNQVQLRFETKEEAISFCEKNDLSYHLIMPKSRTTKLKTYAENFSYARKKNWTH